MIVFNEVNFKEIYSTCFQKFQNVLIMFINFLIMLGLKI